MKSGERTVVSSERKTKESCVRLQMVNFLWSYSLIVCWEGNESVKQFDKSMLFIQARWTTSERLNSRVPLYKWIQHIKVIQVITYSREVWKSTKSKCSVNLNSQVMSSTGCSLVHTCLVLDAKELWWFKVARKHKNTEIRPLGSNCRPYQVCVMCVYLVISPLTSYCHSWMMEINLN